MAIRYRVYPGEEQTHVIAVGKEITPDSPGTGADIGKHPVAEMMVEKAKEIPNFNPHVKTVQGIENHNGLSYQWNEAHEDWAEMRTDHHPTELFTHRPPQITYAMSDPRVRHTIPTMVGLAMQHDKPGMASGQIMADNSLSPHSSKLSQRAAKRGLNVIGDPRNPGMERDEYSDADFPDRTMWKNDIDRRYPIEASPEQVHSARQWVRGQLRPAKPLPSAASSPQFKYVQGQFDL